MPETTPKKEWDFSMDSDERLVEYFNRDVGNPGWVAARGRFHHALFSEFRIRGIDISCIQSGDSVSLARKVKHVVKKLELEVGQKKASGGNITFLKPID